MLVAHGAPVPNHHIAAGGEPAACGEGAVGDGYCPVVFAGDVCGQVVAQVIPQSAAFGVCRRVGGVDDTAGDEVSAGADAV